MTQQPNINLHGAVDLSSLAGPAQGAHGTQGAPQPGGAGTGAQGAGPLAGGAPGGEQGGVVPGPYALDLGEQNLQAVVQTSTQVPVVVVVHSERAQGSRAMADDMEQIAREKQGRFQVARVDADAEPGFVQALGVQALPSVIILLAGQPVPAFQGTADKEQVADIMDQILTMAEQNGIAGRVSGEEGAAPETEPEPLDPNMQAGMDAIDAGDLEAAEAAFRKATVEDPRGDEPRAALAQVLLMRRVTALEDPAATLAAAQSAEPGEVDTQLAAADVEISTGQAMPGLERVLAVVVATRGDERESARERLLELFDVVGAQSPQVADVRRRLASALY